MRWPRFGEAIANLVEDRISEKSLADLSPDQQEILCSEFMRLPDALILNDLH